MEDTFNPLDWIEEPQPPKQEQSKKQETEKQSSVQPIDISTEVDMVVTRIESSLTDITTSYQDWLNVGFAFANQFGEAGRSYFHRVSRFYSGYTKADCDKQFDQCLKSTPSSRCITIKTFFHLAKQAGIDVNTNETKVESNTVSIAPPPSEPPELPTLPDAIFPLLPEFLQRVVEVADSDDERDILLLGALGVLSAVFPKLSGIYDGKKVFSNIYLFVTAPASAGKGRLGFCKQLIMPIHWELRKESERQKQVYDMEMREYNIAKLKDPNAEKPEKPPELMLTIPANSSATGMFQLLADNEGRGLIFETEGDTLALAFKSDHGNYSDGYRKGAHHEMISYYRRTDREYREIKYPCISTVLSGTPKQVSSLIPSAENGLFSRFVFYYMNIRPVWKNVFAKRTGKRLEEHFDDLGQEIFTLHKAMKEHPAMEFCLTPEQEERFNVFFTQIQDKYLTFHGMDYMGTIRRMGLIAFRIAMIFTGLRIMESGDFSEKQVCQDEDFQSALAMVRVLIKHSSHVFSELPEDVKLNKPKDRKEQFLDKLPGKFNRKEFLDLAKSLSIAERTSEKYITIFCEKGLIFREQQGSYIKREDN
ncbi:MAG TPA: DUF3987 domain-containing protein [Prolixibacteraceae bacterium]|nr:DUF3987 domain-containing protein [Prolixibacteraceae bacterium]